MSKLTGTEILKILEENYRPSAVAYGEWGETEAKLTPEQQATIDNVKAQKGAYWGLSKNYILQNLGLGEVIEVDQHGGEGQGDSWHSVKHFVDHDIYIRTNGYYSSGNGTDFYDGVGYEVRPQEKTIVVYES